MKKLKALFKTVWHPKREVAIDDLAVLDQAIADTRDELQLDDEKIDAIQAVARQLKADYKPEAQPAEQPLGKKRVLYTAAQAQARAAALRKANTKKD